MGNNVTRYIVNFSYEPADTNRLLAGFSSDELIKTEVLDFTSTVSKTTTIKVIYPSELDNTNEIHKQAIKNYIHEMGMLSRSYEKGKSEDHNVRCLSVSGLPVYWLTPISQKNPQDSVLKNFYYFKFLLPQISLQNKNILVVLPELCLHFQNVIKQFLVKQNLKEDVIKFNAPVHSKFNYRVLLSYIRVFNKQINEARQNLPKIKGNKNSFNDLIFTSYPDGWKDGERDVVLSGIEKLSLEKGRKVKYCPIFFDYNSLASFKNSEKFDQNYFSYFPSRSQIYVFFKDLVSCFSKVSKLNLQLDQITFVDNTALRYELMGVLLHKLEYFCNYIWLKNYFDKDQNKLNVYYQDEFFNSGRLISESIRHSKNRAINSYGVQHGLFYEAHTVYLITDAEIDAVGKCDGIPMPSRFIVWGNYFKDLFLSYNSLPQSYVSVAGHLDYIFMRRKLAIKNESQRSQTKLLWCTTLKADVVNMYQSVIKDFSIAYPELEIQIRFHPMVDLKEFVLEELLENDLKKRFTYSSHSTIFEAINDADLVLTNSGSTVFLDCLIANKPAINFVNNDYFMGTLGQNEVTNIYDLEGMKKAYSSLVKKDHAVSSASNLLKLDLNEWDLIMSKQKADPIERPLHSA